MRGASSSTGLGRIGWALALGITLFAAHPAIAQDAENAEGPDALFLEAARAFGDEDYARAAELFTQVYALRPETSLLLNQGRAYERAGMSAEAIAAYEQYLEEAPNADERPDIERSLGTLRREVALESEVAEREEALSRASAREVPPPVVTPRMNVDSGPPSGPAPWVMAGAGAATLVVAAVLGGVAVARNDGALQEGSAVEALAAHQDAMDLGLGANVAFGVGGGLLLIGVTWGLLELALSGSDEPASGASARLVGWGAM